jgi:hypothetical protein
MLTVWCSMTDRTDCNPDQPALDCERLVSPSRTTSIADLDLPRPGSSPIASLATRTCSATFPVRSASAPMFFAALARFFLVARVVPRLGRETPKTVLFLPRARAIPAPTPTSPVPAAIAGVLSFLAAEATALPALFAPLTVASFAASTVPLSFDELDFVRCEDALGRALRGDVLAFWERLVPERDFAAVPPLDGARLFDRPPALSLDLRFVC